SWNISYDVQTNGFPNWDHRLRNALREGREQGYVVILPHPLVTGKDLSFLRLNSDYPNPAAVEIGNFLRDWTIQETETIAPFTCRHLEPYAPLRDRPPHLSEGGKR